MKVAFFSARPYEVSHFEALNRDSSHDFTFIETHLTPQTIQLAAGHDALCVFVCDVLDRKVLSKFAAMGGKLVALRSAGYNHVDLKSAELLNLTVVRVPEYSPHAVAEHAAALILALNRKIYRAYNRVREGNFSLDGLTGFDLNGKTVGLVGAGKIGQILCKIMHGFGCHIVAYDPFPKKELQALYGVTYVTLPELYRQSDIISLHVPLTKDTYHLINEQTLQQMKRGVMIINTGRGALIDAKALAEALKSEHVGFAGLDVYEEEEVFFDDHSSDILQDDVLARLMTFPNVLITAHQAFLTLEALHNIARVTLQNLDDYATTRNLPNRIKG